eukprot:scaffold27927_cov31-Phaeocystis_antarctica.AAC.1
MAMLTMATLTMPGELILGLRGQLLLLLTTTTTCYRVPLLTHHASSYSISEDSSEPIEESGTRLILTLKEEADKYTEDFTIRDMLKR